MFPQNKIKPTDWITYAPEFWNEFSENKNTILIDVRNNYETSVGTFKGALNPDTRNFREFKHFVKENKKNFKGKKIGIFVPEVFVVKKHLLFLNLKTLMMYINLKVEF